MENVTNSNQYVYAQKKINFGFCMKHEYQRSQVVLRSHVGTKDNCVGSLLHGAIGTWFSRTELCPGQVDAYWELGMVT
jgi:hypothetical protein